MPSRLRPFHRAVLIVLVVLGVALPAGAQEPEPVPEPLPENPYERLAEVRRREAEAAMKVDLLQVSIAQVQRQLATVESWVDAQESVVAAAQAELVERTLALEAARKKEEAKAAELEELEELMIEIAIEAYMHPPHLATLDVVVSQDLSSAEKADVMLRAKSQRDQDVATELAEAEEALRRLREAAADEAERAEQATDAASSALADLQRARLEQVALAEKVKLDLERTTEEIKLLGVAEADAILAVQRETEELLARIGRESAVPLAKVREFTVHADIASALEAMLAAAEADGVILGGWGHRSTAQQVALRRQHCGGPGISDAEAIYGVPAGSCSPPTAKPGSSMHELGLAIDFTHAGASISTRSSPAFQWLAANAADYGFRNLPSEPWHWSVNGN